MTAKAQYVATFGVSETTHRFVGGHSYTRPNRTACGRTGLMGINHLASGRPIEITCKTCRRVKPVKGVSLVKTDGSIHAGQVQALINKGLRQNKPWALQMHFRRTLVC
ncbi:hypothetical protein [Streptodolium elevatio]|uniref:Uncharacterized protein n=1 Tax=Streptodolium elevatio TaxID=3157996 RepID=A0ABV3DC28_9ACTN